MSMIRAGGKPASPSEATSCAAMTSVLFSSFAPTWLNLIPITSSEPKSLFHASDGRSVSVSTLRLSSIISRRRCA